jgi:hypothetical protein
MNESGRESGYALGDMHETGTPRADCLDGIDDRSMDDLGTRVLNER